MVSFGELRDDAALLSLEHQLRLYDVLGLAAWWMDLEAGRFELSNEQTTVACTDVQFLGTAAPGPQSWLWSWSDPSGYPERIMVAAQQVKEFGDRHGIPELATAEVPFSALPGAPTDPAVVASYMMEVTKAVSGRYTGYQGPVGGGTRAGMLIGHPDFHLPPPQGPRVARVVQQGLTELAIHDQRRALDTYARRRPGLGIVHDGELARVTGPGLTIEVRFDDRNLFTAMSVQMGDARIPPQVFTAPR
ncbi:DUF6882 domain-containing protein [Actinocrispum sp. NPDC049592]|uniref:DUF6882 domain-containing protein n=1 Tax=Actinocrispum sp. NPDC049592 TaxID=3154835 RepID=UPI00344628CE